MVFFSSFGSIYYFSSFSVVKRHHGLSNRITTCCSLMSASHPFLMCGWSLLLVLKKQSQHLALLCNILALVTPFTNSFQEGGGVMRAHCGAVSSLFLLQKQYYSMQILIFEINMVLLLSILANTIFSHFLEKSIWPKLPVV